MGGQMLRYAQHDTTGFGRYSSLSALGGFSDTRIILLKVINTGETYLLKVRSTLHPIHVNKRLLRSG